MTAIEIGDFRNWLRSHPADETYEYEDPWGCLVFQYLRARGKPVDAVGTREWVDTRKQWHPIPDLIHDASISSRTFGAALERLEASA